MKKTFAHRGAENRNNLTVDAKSKTIIFTLKKYSNMPIEFYHYCKCDPFVVYINYEFLRPIGRSSRIFLNILVK